MAPKVFVSHASEDKARFVIPFATALLSKGIDAWVDRWEMKIGDSLVDKIFEEGLKDASAVIVVLSAASVVKPWVREELNAAWVARIAKGTRIIPIVLDDCEVPQALRHLVWETVPKSGDFSETLSRVVDEIFERSPKPALGEPPGYLARPSIQTIAGITTADHAVLAALYEIHLAQPGAYVDPQELLSAIRGGELDESLATESLAHLRLQGRVEILEFLGGPIHARIASNGISAMLGEAENALIRHVGFCILNEGIQRSAEIALKVGEPLPLIEHAIDYLESRGHIMVGKYISEPPTVLLPHPTLRRFLASL